MPENIDKVPILPPNPSSSEPWPLLETAQSALIAATVIIAAIAPLAMPPLVVTLFLITLTRDMTDGRGLAGFSPRMASPATMAGLSFVALAAASAAWAVRPAYTLSSIAQCALTGLGAWYVASSLDAHLRTIGGGRRTRFIRAVPISASIVALYFAIDALTGDATTLFVARNFPWIFDGSEDTFVFQDGIAQSISDIYFNRSAAASSMIAIGLAAAIRFWPRSTRHPALALLVIAGVTLISLKSNSATALLALAVAAIVFALALWSATRTARFIQVAFAIAVIAAVPISMTPKALGLDRIASLPFSFHERVLIWNDIAHDVLETPWFGVGAKSVKFIEKSRTVLVRHGPPVVRPHVFAHPHNGYLQVWIELGLAGALLFTAAGVLLIGRIAHLTPGMQPYALAQTAATLAILGPGWELWQPWLVATIGFGWICLNMLRFVFEQEDATALPHMAVSA